MRLFIVRYKSHFFSQSIAGRYCPGPVNNGFLYETRTKARATFFRYRMVRRRPKKDLRISYMANDISRLRGNGWRIALTIRQMGGEETSGEKNGNKKNKGIYTRVYSRVHAARALFYASRNRKVRKVNRRSRRGALYTAIQVNTDYFPLCCTEDMIKIADNYKSVSPYEVMMNGVPTHTRAHKSSKAAHAKANSAKGRRKDRRSLLSYSPHFHTRPRRCGSFVTSISIQDDHFV